MQPERGKKQNDLFGQWSIVKDIESIQVPTKETELQKDGDDERIRG